MTKNYYINFIEVTKIIFTIICKYSFKTSPVYTYSLLSYFKNKYKSSRFLEELFSHFEVEYFLLYPKLVIGWEFKNCSQIYSGKYTLLIEKLSLAGFNAESENLIKKEKPSWFFLSIEDVVSFVNVMTKLQDKLNIKKNLNKFIKEVLDGHNIFRIVSIKENNSRYIKLKESYYYQFMEPLVYGSNEQIERTVLIQEAFVAEIKNVTITGAFQIKKNQLLIIYDPTSNPKLGSFVSGVWKFFKFIEILGEDYAISKVKFTNTINLKKGILISGRVTENYYHWLIEYVSKLCSVEVVNLPIDIPLIVKKGLPAQFYEALDIINRSSREIIKYDSDNTECEVENLYLVSQHTFLPEDFSKPHWMGGGVDYDHLKFLRDIALDKIKNYEKKDKYKGKKVYLRRSQKGARSLCNESEVYEVIKEFGFLIVHIEELSFLEQVCLFFESDIIFGVEGAAFSNLIFCGSQVRVISLVSERNKDFCIFSNLARFVGIYFIHLTGKNEKSREEFISEDHFVHSSFIADLDKIKKCITENLQKFD